MKPELSSNTPLSGVLLLDKPTGFTSAQLITKVKRQLRLRKHKIGHTGTLDPLATGLLPLLLGEATKFAQYLLKSDKTYIVTGQLGQKTNTADSDGEVIEEAAIPHDWPLRLSDVIPLFKGKIKQVPPAFSALKQNGVPLHQLARAGKEINIAAREITIIEIEILKVDREQAQFQLKVSCGTGTYIRSLIEDIAQALGTVAHVIQLRREKTGPFTIDSALTLENVNASDTVPLLPVDSLIMHFPAVTLDPSCCQRLRYGQRVPVDNTTISQTKPFHLDIANGQQSLVEGGTYRFYDEQGALGGLIEIKCNVIHPLRLLSVDE